MEIVFRWLLRLVGAALTLVVLAAIFVYFVASRSLPDYDSEFAVQGITGEVRILRDNANVPHIFGTKDEDVLFGLGFAQAQDRLWQMTMLRRAAQGRLSELFGARTVKTDELLRRFDLYGRALDSVQVQSPETMALLEAYAAGVNAWIETVNTEALGRGAPEFFLFEPSIAPWTPADSLAVIKVMGLQLAGHLQREVLRARVALSLPPERLADLMPEDYGPSTVALEDFGSLFPEDWDTKSAGLSPLPPLSPVPPLPLAGASNGWAAAPSRAAAGGTLIANDPHLGLSAPSIWYLARLELASGGVIGGTIPGLPVVLVGRSAELGWGLTSAYVDDQDLFIEELNPADPSQYRTPRGWRTFETKRSIINVADAEPVTITLRWTENGPVIPGSHYDIATITPPGHVAALGWSSLSGEDTSIEAGFRLMRSQSVEEAIEAMEGFVAPAQNLTLADRNGIALQVVGAVPARDPNSISRGRIPGLGWKQENRWQGRLDYALNPRVVNPPSGILGNTNNKTTDQPFPEHLSHSWGDSQRIKRWERLMAERQVHTRESFIAAQLDTVSEAARGLLPLIGRDLWFTGEAAAPGTPEYQRQRALELLANWNGEMNEHLPEPLIYAVWMRRLQQKLIVDDLGPLADAFTHPEPLFLERVFANTEGAAAWCDIIQSSIVESCTDTARIALDEALIWIGQRYGSALESLRWGNAHEALHEHQVLGEAPVLKWFVNIVQSTSGGDHTLMRGKTAGDGDRPLANVHAAGYRGVYDFADPDSSVFVISTGQSGHPLSRHYDDLGELWRQGEYVPMSLDIELARAGSVGLTVLTPR